MMQGMKRLRPLSRMFGLLIVGLGSLMAGVPAVAAEVPKLDKGDEGWIGVVIAIVLVIAVGVASFINPKRGHQD